MNTECYSKKIDHQMMMECSEALRLVMDGFVNTPKTIAINKSFANEAFLHVLELDKF